MRAGITDILIITNRGKELLEDHFDRAPELEERLLAGGKQAMYDEVVGLAHLANICYIRQKETKGLGHAISCAKAFVGDEPFAVLYGDDVILGETPPAASSSGRMNRSASASSASSRSPRRRSSGIPR